MSTPRKLVGIASALVLGLPQTGMAGGDKSSVGGQRLAMDDNMISKPGSTVSGRSNMAPEHDHGEMLIRTEKMMRGQISDTSGVARVPANAAELAEERIAFLKAELQITEQQAPDWNALAEALRSGRQHLTEARKLAVLNDNTPSAERLERYERHLAERLKAVRSAHAGFTRLHSRLSDVQKQTAATILLPLIATF